MLPAGEAKEKNETQENQTEDDQPNSRTFTGASQTEMTEDDSDLNQERETASDVWQTGESGTAEVVFEDTSIKRYPDCPPCILSPWDVRSLCNNCR